MVEITKIRLTAGVFVLLAVVGASYYISQGDKAYSCLKDGETIIGLCDRLSKVNAGGLQTRCYYETNSSRYKYCKTGWEVYKGTDIKGNITDLPDVETVTINTTTTTIHVKTKEDKIAEAKVLPRIKVKNKYNEWYCPIVDGEIDLEAGFCWSTEIDEVNTKRCLAVGEIC